MPFHSVYELQKEDTSLLKTLESTGVMDMGLPLGGPLKPIPVTCCPIFTPPIVSSLLTIKGCLTITIIAMFITRPSTNLYPNHTLSNYLSQLAVQVIIHMMTTKYETSMQLSHSRPNEFPINPGPMKNYLWKLKDRKLDRQIQPEINVRVVAPSNCTINNLHRFGTSVRTRSNLQLQPGVCLSPWAPLNPTLQGGKGGVVKEESWTRSMSC